MKKIDVLMKEMKPIIDNQEELEKFIMDHSNLPGPRGNLELAFGFAELYEDMDVLLQWTRITEEQADGNHPKSFLAFCSAVCLGKLYTKKKDKRIIPLLKHLANDGRWRMREAVAFGFQSIGEYDFDELKTICSEWITHANNLEKRAMLVSLAHPPFLTEERAAFCFDITDCILEHLDREHDFDVLKKGLEFTISVFAAADPKAGFSFIDKWIGKDATIDRILKSNLKKNRLIRKNPEEVKRLLDKI